MQFSAKVAPNLEEFKSAIAKNFSDTIVISPGEHVALSLSPDMVTGYVREGTDLVINLANGEVVRVANFYASPEQASRLYLTDAEQQLVAAELSEMAAGTITATYAPQGVAADFASLATAGGGLGAAGILGGVLLAGGGLAAALGGGGGNIPEPSPPPSNTAAPAAATDVTINANGTQLTGRAEPGTTVRVDVNGDGSIDYSGAVNSEGRFTIALSPSLINSETVTVTVTDSTENRSAPTTITAPDLTPPEPASGVSIPQDGTSLTGSAEPGALVSVDTNGDGIPDQTATADGDGTFTIPLDPPLTNGETVTVTIVDAAGNESDLASIVAPDLLPPPPAPVIEPTNGTMISGTAAPGSLVSISADSALLGTATADANGNWTFTPSPALADGTMVSAYASNNEGEASTVANVTVDAVPPAAPIIDPSNGTEIAGTAEAGALVILINGNGNPIGTTTADGTGHWTFTPSPALRNGTIIQATATDPAGNVSPVAITTIDAAAPRAPKINPSNGTELVGTAEPGADVVLIYADGTPIGTATADDTGNWRFTPSQPLAHGAVVEARAVDAAGNVGPATATTIDAAPPAAPVLEPSNGTELSGTAEPGSMVTLTDSTGNPIGTVKVDKDGNWRFTPAQALPDGTQVKATATDAVGNISSTTSVTIDAVPPVAPTIDPSNGINLIGTAEAGSTVTLTDGAGNPIGTATADSSSNWSFSPTTPLGDGTIVKATATDAAGNSSGPVSIIVDAVPPAAPTVFPSNGTVVTGTTEPGAAVTLTDANGTSIGTVIADASGNWTFTPSPALPNGTIVTITAKDAAGNSSGPATSVIDATPPAAPVVTPSNGTTLAGTAEPGATVTLTYGDGTPVATVTADASGNWAFEPVPALANGIVVQATATDPAGNVSSAATVTIDAVAPDAPTVAPSNGAELVGTAEPGADVVLIYADGTPIGTATADDTGNWRFTPSQPLAHGAVVEARAVDAAGNVGPATATTIDAAPPAAPVLEPSNGTELSGTAEPGSLVTLTDGDGNLIGTVQADPNGNWRFTPAPVLTDSAQVRATATDAAGNVSPVAMLSVDAIAPEAPTIDQTNGKQISGTAEAGSTVTLSDENGNPIGTATADSSGAWTFTPSPALPDGTVIKATATDAAGNISLEATETVDASLPSPPTIDPTNGTILSGTADPGDTVTVTVNGVPIGQDVADGNGYWSVVPDTQLPDGTVVTAVAERAPDNRSAPATETVDGAAPAAPVIEPSDGTEIAGTAEPGALVTLTDGNGDPIGTTTADGTGRWTFTPSPALGDGMVIQATATDAAGNVSPPASTTVDSLAPMSPTIDPTNGIAVSGTADPGATITLTDGNGDPIGTTIADGSGNWAIALSPALADGTVVTAVARDAAGNVSTPASETVDAVAPLAPVIIIASGETVSGTAEAGATVTLTDSNGNPIGTVQADAGGAWTFAPSPTLANNAVVNATATDAAGNVSTPAKAVVDALAPATPSIAPSNGTEITGTAEPGATITLTDGDGAPIGTTMADGSGNWRFTPVPALPNGTVVNATATDADLNTSGIASITVDTVPPSTPIVHASGGTVLTGTAEAGSIVTLTDGGGNPIGQVTADGSGNWRFTPGQPLSNGAVVNVTATDAAGNRSNAASTTIDAGAPLVVVPEAAGADVWINAAEAADGIQVRVALQPNTNIGDSVSLSFNATPQTPRTVGAADLANGFVIFTVAGPFTDGPASVTAAINGGTTSALVSFTIDTAAPEAMVAITSISDDSGTAGDFQTDDRSPTIGGTLSSPLSAGERVEISLDGGASWAQATVSGTSWFYGPGELELGSHTATVRLIDAAGNIGSTASQAIVITNENQGPVVQSSSGALLGLLSAEALAGLVDIGQQSLVALDPDGDLRTVVVRYQGTLGLGANTLTASLQLAEELGLTVSILNDNRLLAPTSTVTITANDHGSISNLAINELLATIHFEQGLLGVQVLGGTTITAIDSANQSASAAAGTLLNASLLNSTGNPAVIEGGESNNVLAGTEANERLYGYAGDDTLSGGAGNDLLRGGAGADALHGGSGNDLLIYDALDTLIDGGDGIDLLLLEDGTMTLDAATNVRNIERIDLGTGDDGRDLTLTADGVLQATDSDDQLIITGEENDTVTMTGATLQGQTLLDGHAYSQYTLGTTSILIEDAVTVVT